MSSEIIDDIRVSTIEIASDSGLNLSNFNARLKHTGAGTFTLTSTSTLDNAISIDLPNGGLDVNVQKTIDFKALDSTETAITLQGLTGGIEINAYRNIQLTSQTESINLDTSDGDINLTSSDNIILAAEKSIAIESGLSDCAAINIIAPFGGINTYSQNILTSCGQTPFYPFNQSKTGISPQLANIMAKISPISSFKNNILESQQNKLQANSLLCPIGFYSQASDYVISMLSDRSQSSIDNGIPGTLLLSFDAATVISALGASGLPEDEGYINSDLILFSEGQVIINAQGISGILIGTQNTTPITMGTIDNTTTINGDLIVSGNFTVNGDTVQNNVTVFTSEDPVFYLNTGISGTDNTNDIGFIGKRGNLENVGWIWKESQDEWVAIGTDSNGVDNIDNDINDYKPARFGGLNVVSDTSRGPTATVFNVDVNGQINLETSLTNLDAITVTSAGGIDITASGVSKDIDITATGSVNITSNEGTIDGIVLTSTGGIDINTVTGTDITNTGSSTALVVNQNGTGQDVVVFKDNGITALIVKDGGTVGINTTSPSSSYKLDVNGNSNVSGRVYQDAFMLVPPGSIMPYAVSSAPGGWLLCDGSAVSRSTYATLFSLIGSTYGNGNGYNTFNLPDMRGRMIVGFNSSDTSFDSLGETGGSKTATLTTNELPAHTHSTSTTSNGSHTHSITDPGHNHYFTTINDDYNNSGTNPPGFSADSAGLKTWYTSNSYTGITVNSVSDHSHTVTVNSTGSGNSFSIMNPYMVLNYIIKY